jgi:hypothetical protein
MRKAFLLASVALLFVGTLFAQEVLNNDSVIKLAGSGLSEGMVVNIVNTQPGKYSLTPDDLIALKKAGVSERIMRAMLNKSASGQAPATAAPVSESPAAATAVTGGAAPANEGKPSRASPVGTGLGVPTEPGVYALGKGGNLQRVEGRVTSFVRSGSHLGSAATLGIHASRINTQIPGTRASVTVSPTPTFYYRAVEDQGGVDLILTRLTVKSGRRQFEVGAQGVFRKSEGVSVRHQLDFDAEQVEPRVYKIVLAHELKKGQYAFYLLRGFEHAAVREGSGFVYCFQVE